MKKRYFAKRALCTVLCAATAMTAAAAGASSASADVYLLGDVNFDEKINSADALAILRFSADLQVLDFDAQEAADYDGDGKITSRDALLVLRKYFDETRPVIEFPTELTAACGDRIDISAKMYPEDLYGNVTFTYEIGNDLSDDGLTDEYGDAYTVLDYTNTGRIKAFHPGTSTVTAVASNGKKAVCTVTVKDMITVKTIKSGNLSMTVTTHMMTNNDCYNMTNDFTQFDGVVVHSTATPGVAAYRWYDLWNHPNTDAAVHSFLDDKGVYNYLPLDQTAWHAGQPANRTYLDFEICEPGGFSYVNNVVTGYDRYAQQTYFNAIWRNATLYTAYLCSLYDLTADDVISHGEAGRMGIGTAHGDPDHWFVFHDKTMDDFRKDVDVILRRGVTETEATVVSGSPVPSASADDIPDIGIFDVWGDDDWR